MTSSGRPMNSATVRGRIDQYSCEQVARPRSMARSMTFCMYMPTSDHCSGPILRSMQKNRPTGASKNTALRANWASRPARSSLGMSIRA